MTTTQIRSAATLALGRAERNVVQRGRHLMALRDDERPVFGIIFVAELTDKDGARRD